MLVDDATEYPLGSGIIKGVLYLLCPVRRPRAASQRALTLCSFTHFAPIALLDRMGATECDVLR